MDLPHMQALYQTGRLSDAVAVMDRTDNSWLLDCHDLWGHTLHLTEEDGETCHFGNLQEAESAARQIGFSNLSDVEH